MPHHPPDPNGVQSQGTRFGIGMLNLRGAEDRTIAPEASGRTLVTARAFRTTATPVDVEARAVFDSRRVKAVEASRLAQGLPSRVADPVILRHIAIVFLAPYKHRSSVEVGIVSDSAAREPSQHALILRSSATHATRHADV
jgi:hypothetical protein